MERGLDPLNTNLKVILYATDRRTMVSHCMKNTYILDIVEFSMGERIKTLSIICHMFYYILIQRINYNLQWEEIQWNVNYGLDKESEKSGI